MRVLLITAKYPPTPCGVGDHTFGLAKTLVTYGHEVTVYTSSAEKPLSAENLGQTQVIREVAQWDFSVNARLLEWLSRSRIELVHLQYTASSHNHPVFPLFPWTVKRRARPPVPRVVVTLHELAAPITQTLPGPIRRAWLIPLLCSADALIATSERDVSHLRRLPFLASKLRYIPLPSNLPVHESSKADRQQIRSKLGIRDDEILLARFGFVSNVRVALFSMVLRSVRQLLDRGHRVKLLFIGGGDAPDQAAVLALARRLGLETQVLFTGYCAPADASRYLQSADIVVQPYPEGVCERRSSLQAAIAHPLPIVSTCKGPAPSLFIHRENVMLAPVGDSTRMAEVIAELIEDPELRRRIQANMAGTALRFTWDAAGRRINELYQALGSAR